MTRIHTIILISCVILLFAASGTVAAQETTTASAPTKTTTAATPTTASESSDETTYYGDVAGDRAVRIVSTEYVDGTAVLVLESDLPRTVTMIAPTGLTSTGTATGNLIHRPISPGRTTIQIDSPEPWVTPVTSCFVKNGQYTEVRLDDDDLALIAGSFAGTDMRDAVIDSALGTSFDAPPVIIQRHFGLHRNMERVT